ncbi:sensor histidine kinase [Streptomyces sioyaensis]|uniref:sensor histidine kinase n=1 Tax=Streptomyces sioyaensis TaxID=67364 RepID=UPI0037900DA5
MQRLYVFLRRRPTMVDSFWAVFLFGFSWLWVVEDGFAGADLWTAAIQACALCTAVALRRRAPEKMLLLATAAGVFQLVVDVPKNLADFAMLVIVYTVAANGARWASRFALVGGLAAPLLDYARWPHDYGPGGAIATVIVFLAVPFALAWVLGDSVRTRRAYYAQLEERAAQLEKERDARAKVAVAAERARIARELHDVVAHNVSVMVVQADGAAYVLDAAPEQCEKALETISGTGRQALAEMRRLLGMLRTGEPGEDSGERAPQPDVGRLDDLIEQVRGAGLPVDFTVQGTPRPLSSGVELTAYRIVQEALTNTRKHGGPDVSALVRLVYGSDALDLLVEDDGRGAQHEVHEQGGADRLGHGLIGMRERVGMVGGRLDAGPRPGGGFRISAVLPVKPVG